jgi:hypothetical protein
VLLLFLFLNPNIGLLNITLKFSRKPERGRIRIKRRKKRKLGGLASGQQIEESEDSD